MLRKTTSILFVLFSCLLFSCPVFAIGTEDVSKYLTKYEFDKEINKLEKEIDGLAQGNYEHDILKEVKKLYSVNNAPFSEGDGISIIATQSNAAGLQWVISKNGGKMAKIPNSTDGGIDATRNQLLFMTPEYSKKTYFVRFAPGEGPHVDLTNGTKLALETKCEVIREKDKGEITAYVASTGKKYTTYTNNAGATWSGWHYDQGMFQYVACDTPSDKAIKQVYLDGYDLEEGSMLVVNFNNRQSATGPIKLKVNDYEEKTIIYTDKELGEDAWAKNTKITFVYDGANFQVLTADKQIKIFLCDLTNATTDVPYTDNDNVAHTLQISASFKNGSFGNMYINTGKIATSTYSKYEMVLNMDGDYPQSIGCNVIMNRKYARREILCGASYTNDWQLEFMKMYAVY